MNRRDFVESLGVASLAIPAIAAGANSEFDAIWTQVEKQHNQTLKLLQQWIAKPGIAAENLGMTESCEFTMQLLRDAGFTHVAKIPTDGFPGILATVDVGAPKTLGLYFMHDVKQVDPAEWSSPPFAGALVDKPGLGKVLIGRGAVNQKGPQLCFLAALHAIRAAGKKLPVNLVLVVEGEEEIASPHFKQIVDRPEVAAALKRCTGVFMPAASQNTQGIVTLNLGGKGALEVELIASGERWGRGPKVETHSGNRAMVDSPAWHLVQALNSLVAADGNTPAIDNFLDKVRPISDAEKKMIAVAAEKVSEAAIKRQLGVDRWIGDASWRDALEMLVSRPTVNIQGLVGGYTGPGGKTILPSKVTAKLDLRLVPDMTAAETKVLLKKHLEKRGFGDIEIKMVGYDPTSTPANSSFITAMTSVYKRNGIDLIVMPRAPGSWPGYVFTGDPLRMPAGHFGLGNGGGAHAPDEYFLIESTNPKVSGLDGATRSYVEYLYEVARA